MSSAAVKLGESAGGQTGFALFAYGFRPFFLLAGLAAVAGVAVWVPAYAIGWSGQGALPLIRWHMHEMLFGFVPAAVAGFLLTAVPSWTGRRGFAGAPLLLLTGLWLAGRLALNPWVPLGPVPAAVLDLAFLPALLATVAPQLIAARNYRNLLFLGLLGLLFLGNLLCQLEIVELTRDTWDAGIRLAIDTILLLVALVGGRIVPSFTLSGMRKRGLDLAIAPAPTLDRLALLSLLALGAVDQVQPDSRVAGAVALVAALVHAVRFARWHGHRTGSEPIVWILHLGYLWIPIGLALKAAWLLAGSAYGVLWVHALTIGAFATMIVAVMTRAALGHTGREIKAAAPTVVAYVLLTLAAIIRVSAPLWPGEHYLHTAEIAGALGIAAFLLVLFVYAPILLRPRVDGRPG
jgi:uncharacterized protein involved in response to NO